MRAELSAKPEEYLLCRDKMHRWDPLDAKPETVTVLLVVEKCSICTAERTSLLSLRKSTRGHIIRRWMSKYPQGYLMPKGTGRMDIDDRGEIRLHNLGY